MDCSLILEGDTATPSSALEYTYGKRTKKDSLARDVVHTWEVGIGLNAPSAQLSSLLEITISSQCTWNEKQITNNFG